MDTIILIIYSQDNLAFDIYIKKMFPLPTYTCVEPSKLTTTKFSFEKNAHLVCNLYVNNYYCILCTTAIYFLMLYYVYFCEKNLENQKPLQLL